MNKIVLLLVITLTSQIFAIENQLPRKSSGWANLQLGKSLTEGSHGAFDLNYQFKNDHFAIQILFYQFCSTTTLGCVSAPHDAFSFLYGKSLYLNPRVLAYAQTGVATLSSNLNCKPVLQSNGDIVNECGKTNDIGLPLRAGILAGKYIGLSLEFNGLITANNQIFGVQLGLPMGVF